MSKVVYRGASYDTEVRRQEQAQQQPQQHNETYRGVKFVKEGKWWKNLTSYNSLKNKNKKKIVVTKHNLFN